MQETVCQDGLRQQRDQNVEKPEGKAAARSTVVIEATEGKVTRFDIDWSGGSEFIGTSIVGLPEHLGR